MKNLKSPPTEEEVKKAIRVILTDKKNYTKSLNCVVEHCRAGLFLSGNVLKTQILYILSNLSYWRGNGNKEARKVLESFVE